MKKAVLQVALDFSNSDRALGSHRNPWMVVQTGSGRYPLIKSEGMHAIRSIRNRFPDTIIVADMKVADTGTLEVEMAAKAGASIVCILADADDPVIAEAVRAARLYGIRIMADLINVRDPIKRAPELEAMGVDIICAHVGIDQQMIGKNSIALLTSLSGLIHIPLAVAGGISAATAGDAVKCGADIVIVGGWIVRSAEVSQNTRKIRAEMDDPLVRTIEKKSPDEEIRSLLLQVSAPNITDAMHRKGAMSGILSICGNVKMVGKAVTVQTVAGDWAKPVEAIDIAGKNEVIVINNDGATHIAPWGELATLSCLKKGYPGGN